MILKIGENIPLNITFTGAGPKNNISTCLISNQGHLKFKTIIQTIDNVVMMLTHLRALQNTCMRSTHLDT